MNEEKVDMSSKSDINLSSDESAESDDDIDKEAECVTGFTRLSLIDEDESGILHQSTSLDNRPALYAGEEEGEEEEGEGVEQRGPQQISSVLNNTAQESLTSTGVIKDDETADKLKKKRKRKRLLCINLTSCKYDCVRRSALRYGFREVGEEEDWNLYWTDFSVSLERVMDMKRYQKINHFPGMSEICRKDLLARNMNRLRKLFPKDYNVYPPSWCLPADHGELMAYARKKKNKTYILKPESGCQGKGIWLTRCLKDIRPNEHMLCQQYISRPFLIDGFKFDLRIYVLVTSCDPLRIFVFKEGLGRFATHSYTTPTNSNVNNVFMHLTNYAVNKNSGEFIRDEEAGSKRRLSTINRWLKEHDHDVDKLWSDIDDIIIKTIISAHAVLRHNYRTCFPNHSRGSACFEILGFDVVLDKKLKPYVLEVNHSPSFTTDSVLDREIKDTLIYDTLVLVNFGAVDRRRCVEEDRRRVKERLLTKAEKKETKDEVEKCQQKWTDEQLEYEDKHLGNFRRIYPVPSLGSGDGVDPYEKYLHNSGSLYQETAAFKARSECARQFREELTRKQEKLASMLGGRKRRDGAGALRPESPFGPRPRGRVLPRRPKPITKLTVPNSAPDDLTADTLPIDKDYEDIDEWEESQRIQSLQQRDRLIREMGVINVIRNVLLLAATINTQERYAIVEPVIEPPSPIGIDVTLKASDLLNDNNWSRVDFAGRPRSNVRTGESIYETDDDQKYSSRGTINRNLNSFRIYQGQDKASRYQLSRMTHMETVNNNNKLNSQKSWPPSCTPPRGIPTYTETRPLPHIRSQKSHSAKKPSRLNEPVRFEPVDNITFNNSSYAYPGMALTIISVPAPLSRRPNNLTANYVPPRNVRQVNMRQHKSAARYINRNNGSDVNSVSAVNSGRSRNIDRTVENNCMVDNLVSDAKNT